MSLRIFIPVCLSILIFACSDRATPSGTTAAGKKEVKSVSSPPCIIYKTKSDFSKKIPVILNDEKTMIVSYPDVKDVFFNGKLAYPTQLIQGYLLDNRGIGPNVAFILLTYEQYSRMEKTPPVTQLFELITEKEPLVEMYRCGSRNDYKDVEKELNDMISSGKLKDCTRLK